MARGRLGGATGYAVGLVIVSIFFVLTLILAIVFATQISDAEARAGDAERTLRSIILPAERSDPKVLDLMKDPNQSVVGQLLRESNLKSQIITGNENYTLDMIRKDLAIAQIPPGRPILAELQRQLANVNDLQQQVDQLKQDAAAALERAKTVEREKSQLEAAFNESVRALEQQVAQMQRGNTEYQGSVDRQREQLEQRIIELQDRIAREASDFQAQLAQKDSLIADLRKRIADLQPTQLAADGEDKTPIDPSRVPDGSVITVIRDAPLVYIDIGASEHVLLGMTFEVYDKSSGIVTDEFGTLRGKATVEVVRVEAGSSLCRIVRRDNGSLIYEGDIIGNAVYDPNMTLRFHVYGEFDIEDSGQATVGDRRRIEAMITRWGGEVMDRLTYQTDFLVLGQEPELPEPLAPDEIDPVKIAEHAAKTRRYEQYQTLIAEAKALSIPILNQNRFLTMVGHYQR